MAYDYAKTGLPANPAWEKAAGVCHAWLTRHMSMFNEKQINAFMKNQPVAAAKRLIETCPDVSPEAVTLALIGPAKGAVVAGAAAEAAARRDFGDRAVDMILALDAPEKADAPMRRDIDRLFLVEGLSMMHDQLIGRARIDAHHNVRWNILISFEDRFDTLRGRNPALDALFAEGLSLSREALERLDKSPKPPRPPRPGV